MAYMDLFDDPLAPTYHSANNKDGLPQMDRSARHAQIQSDPSLADMATDYGKQKAMNLADEKVSGALETGVEKGLTKGKSFFKDLFGMSGSTPTAGTASSLANQTAMTEAAGLTGAEMAAGAGSQLATGAGTELAAAKMAEQAGLNALVSSGGTGAATAATTGATTGAMAGLGAAVPYIGAGLVLGKAFGLFSEGGKAGPLYAARGDKAKEEDEGFFQGLANSVSDATDYVMGKGRAGEKSKEFLQGYRSQGGPMYAGMGMLAMADKMKEKEMMPGILGVAQQYMSSGDLVGPLALRKIKYKENGGKIELEATMGD